MMTSLIRTLMIALLWAGIVDSATAALPNNAVETASAPTDKADTAKANPDQVIEGLLSGSGIKLSLEKMPKNFQDGFRNSLDERAQSKKGALPPEVRQTLEASVKESFTVQGFMGRVNRALKKDYTEGSYQELLTDLSTPSSTRMEELEKKGAPAEEVWSSFFVDLKSDPKSEQRLELIKRLDAARRDSDVLSSILVATAKGMTSSVAIASGCINEKQLDGVEAGIKGMLDGLADNGRYMAQALLAYTFREVSDAELAEYVKLFEKENAKHIYDVVVTAIGEEISQDNTRMVHSFMKTIREKQAAKGNRSCGGGNEAGQQPTLAQSTEPSVEKTVAEKPAVEKPAAEKPAADEHAAKGRAAETRSPPASAPVSSSSIPQEKRQGADARKCLDLATDKEIAACAEKFR